MSILFDSPIDYCPVANRYVLLDQTRDACAREMACGKEQDCPLAYYFARRAPAKPGRARRIHFDPISG